ncbi:MAG TPA: hypothetical protein VFH58_04665 [Acidimicrobiales bacterium]|nr:hypothetical protein [Acidimicrobiales bacterium]
MIGRLIEFLLARSRRNAWKGSRTWMAVGALSWLWRRYRSRRDPHPVWTEELAPGQSVLIVHESS